MPQISFTKEALLDTGDIILWYKEQRMVLSYDFELCLDVGLAEVYRNLNNRQTQYKYV